MPLARPASRFRAIRRPIILLSTGCFGFAAEIRHQVLAAIDTCDLRPLLKIVFAHHYTRSFSNAAVKKYEDVSSIIYIAKIVGYKLRAKA